MGRPRKSVAELKRLGTFRMDRHADRLPTPDSLCFKPAHRPKTKCGDPHKWARTVADEHAIASGCWFDERQAAYVVEWFAKYLKHSKGDWAGKPFELLKWQQRDIIYPLFGWFRDSGKRRFQRAYIEIPKKNGKALALDTPIPTPTGWTTMGELRVGDVVFDENGLECRVTAATDVMHDRLCYSVEFSDGCKIVADADHQWVTIPRSTGRPVGGSAPGVKLPKRMVFTTEEIAQTLRIASDVRRGRMSNNHSVDVAGALHCEAKTLPIAPYVLGAWLGDGDSGDARLTLHPSDNEILDAIVEAGCGVSEPKAYSDTTVAVRVRLGRKIGCLRGHPMAEMNKVGQCRACERERDRAQRRGEPAPTITNKSMRQVLCEMGLINNKHIPGEYLRSSIEQRLALMQGLMDTDGCVSKAGQCEFATVKPALRDGFIELARSLGYKPSLFTGRATICGRDCGEKYRIQFFAFGDMPVFRLARKRARLKPMAGDTRSSRRRIVNVVPVQSVPVRCIQVDSPSHLYLAGDGMIPTHNSTLASGIGLYMLAGDGENGPEVYSCATDKDQASIVHGEAINMVEASEQLAAWLKVNRTNRNILFDDKRGAYKAISSKPAGKEGLNGNCWIADELHAWYGDELWNALRYMGAARSNPMGFAITTAGDDMESICRRQHDFAVDVIKGTNGCSDATMRFFGYIRGLEPGEDYDTHEARAKANPSLGETIQESELIADVEEARLSPTAMASCLRYRFNVWSTSANPFISLDVWKDCEEKFELESLKGQPCWAALDLARTRDFTAFAMVFHDEAADVYRLVVRYWLPEDTAMERKNLASFLVWAENDWITLTSGDTCDYQTVEDEVCSLLNEYEVREMAYDKKFANEISQRIALRCSGTTLVESPQTSLHMAAPIQEFERKVMRGQLRHNKNPVLTWQAGHVQARTDKSGKPELLVKPGNRNDYRTIDGVQVACMALGRAMMGGGSPSVYETAGVKRL